MNGILLAPGNLHAQSGRDLSCLFDATGRVYSPHPYDVPQRPIEVTAFALNMVMTAIDRQILNEKSRIRHFKDFAHKARYRIETENLLRGLECEHQLQYFHTGNEGDHD